MVEKKKNGIQSIDVGFSILKVLLNSPSPMPLKKISEMSGLTPSKIHSYLVSFSNLGMVDQNHNTGFYSLGPFSLKLGLGYLDQVDLISVAKPIMQNLAMEIGQTVFLGVWGNHGATLIHRADGHYSETIFDLRIGSVLPLLSSALGKNFAAHLPENIVRPLIIEEMEKNQNRAGIPKSLSAANELLETIKTNGISQGRGMLLSDYTAISVPIFDFSGTISAGLTIMGRVDNFDDRLEGRPAGLLIDAGKQISATRGFVV